MLFHLLPPQKGSPTYKEWTATGGFDEEMADTGMSPEFDDEPAVGEEQKLTVSLPYA